MSKGVSDANVFVYTASLLAQVCFPTSHLAYKIRYRTLGWIHTWQLHSKISLTRGSDSQRPSASPGASVHAHPLAHYYQQGVGIRW